MADCLVLVHSPVVSPSIWDKLAPALVQQDRRVVIPDLTDTMDAGPPYCSRQATRIADSAGDRSVILVGHSGAGPLLMLAGSMSRHVEGYVFIDAGLPCPGQSWLDTTPSEVAAHIRDMANDGWLPPWSEWWGDDGLAEMLPDPEVRERFAATCPRLPLAMFEEVYPDEASGPYAPSAYLRLSEAYEQPAREAKALGWPTIELMNHHLCVLTDPELVAAPLLRLVGHLQER